jgi:hypothetical protein
MHGPLHRDPGDQSSPSVRNGRSAARLVSAGPRCVARIQRDQWLMRDLGE